MVHTHTEVTGTHVQEGVPGCFTICLDSSWLFAHSHVLLVFRVCVASLVRLCISFVDLKKITFRKPTSEVEDRQRG